MRDFVPGSLYVNCKWINCPYLYKYIGEDEGQHIFVSKHMGTGQKNLCSFSYGTASDIMRVA